MHIVKRTKEEIDVEYKKCAVNFGDREYKIKCLKQALEPLEKDAHLLFVRMNQINLEIAKDYPEVPENVAPEKPPEACTVADDLLPPNTPQTKSRKPRLTLVT